MTTILGFSAGSHDAAISIVKDNKILFASQSERFSRIKNDPNINDSLIECALNNCDKIDKIVFYEKPFFKKMRQIYSGQIGEVIFSDNNLKKLLYKIDNKYLKVENIFHHQSHAAQAYLSPFNKAIVLVIDAIGEWNTISIWLYDLNNKKKFKKLETYSYPHSLGLLYSAFTKLAGYKPNEEEYIYMALSSIGEDKYSNKLYSLLFNNNKLKTNLHCGFSKEVINYIISLCINDKDCIINLAASVQKLLENQISLLFNKVKYYQNIYNTDNIIYSGGVALNCVANSKIQKEFKNNLWIFPNPGDSGASLGAALYANNQKVYFDNMYMGLNIDKKYPINDILNDLFNEKITAVANGKAEFGPRALGNRSLLADPRGKEIKDKVNNIKAREYFRPFAPVILEEMFPAYFETDNIKQSPYMQYTYKCKFPEQFPAIIHLDGTSRVQTVNKNQNINLYKLLTKFYKQTGCPMLLNTSLNIKGQPIVNNIEDAKEFSAKYKINVHS